jgi:hypothetical protein
MPRYPTRLLTPALIAALFLAPTLATARPINKDAALSAPKRLAAGPSVLSKIGALLSALWAETGSGLEPNGSTTTGSGTKPYPVGSGDNGSGLDPDG